ncbi:hypothetical protein [Streptomyces sp. TS71-3]|nr:hypothetical protein [Streptomyces sp. TS71-3]
MAEHVHVRLVQGLGVTEDGELVEQFRCRCGASWTRRYEAESTEPE